MKIYFAGQFARLSELVDYKRELESSAPNYGATIEVTSRWLLGGHAWSGTPEEELPVDVGARFALEDIEDLRAATIIVCFTEPRGTGPARGGRHVEFGYALAYATLRETAIYVVGHRENVFYCLDEVEFHESWEEARGELLAMASISPTMARHILDLERQLAQQDKVIDELTAAVGELSAALALPEVATAVEVEQEAYAEPPIPAVLDDPLPEPDPEPVAIEPAAVDPPPEPARRPAVRATSGNVVIPAPKESKKKLLGAGNTMTGRALPEPPAEIAEKAGSWNADRVRRLQALLDINNEDLGRRLGVSGAHVSNWRRGAYAPSEKYWPALDELEREAKQAV